MNKKYLMYGFISLATVGIIAGLAMTNQSQAEVRITGENPFAQSQEKPLEQNTHHLKQSGTTATPSMGMMNHPQAEQHFIPMMIHHYQITEEMTNLALDKAQRPEIKQFAQAIQRERNREIEQIEAWYKQWYGTEVPAVSEMGMPIHLGGNQDISLSSGTGRHLGANQEMPRHQDMNTIEMMNMMGGMNMMAVDLEALKNAPDFDKAFIEQMIPHQKMAVMMAGMVLDSNRPEIRNLAQSILQEESAEIEQMRQWYQSWYQ
ncbi:MAG: DUF305 domain-containing protein [Oscillatoria sp. PMC 1051.18]|uniref:DUF305 domain-containing protein n=1 Tax=Oscillatoria salina TaxID=331517 RepID=UPI0013B60D5A|nr:DUF305 domain-containing protein [Oscillatoria salina]MBZ8181097.1 DUF305 domain-containing protein [Oscillatoria salina IIICB1]MEC4895058.1 DUF305 domain-containing protein [Oscillatoria sp. PMC 1050.18]MEC5030536.1 DUF305 domain-containing protein [Oscillatoria sp. PMC 1051.18]NET88781.1 DUF305 domain-containing protein [Kamptonema sp. SIO1D9]